MNPIIAGAMGNMLRQDEENKLARLRDQLAELGVRAGLRDSNSALMVHRPDPGLPVWVFVGYGGAYYSWQNADKRHAADDPQGAARALVEYIGR